MIAPFNCYVVYGWRDNDHIWKIVALVKADGSSSKGDEIKDLIVAGLHLANGTPRTYTYNEGECIAETITI